MLIGFDGSRAFVENRTGTENYSYQLLKHLAKIDSKNSYLVYLRPGNEVNISEWPANFKFELIAYPRLWTQVGLAMETFADKLDILFTPAHTIPLVRKPGLKTVMTVHDLGSEYLPGMHQIKQRLYLDFITKFQLKSASALIAVSQATKDDLVKKVGIDPGKVEVIYEGVEDAEVDVKDDALVDVLNKFDLKKENYFLFVGTIQPRKNLTRLIEAFSHVISNGLSEKSLDTERDPSTSVGMTTSQNDTIKLVLAGGKGWLSDEIYALPKKLGIEEKVKFLGRVSDEDLPYLYSGALGLTFPSLFEGFGLPILEAMKYGCPVLTSNLSSMPEVAGNSAILIDPYDTESIINGLSKLQDKQFRESLIAKGFKQVKKLNWEKCSRETLDLLERLAKK